MKHHLGYNINADISNNDTCSFSYFVRTAGEVVYCKQTAVYEILCISYILNTMDLYELLNDDMKQKNTKKCLEKTQKKKQLLNLT